MKKEKTEFYKVYFLVGVEVEGLSDTDDINKIFADGFKKFEKQGYDEVDDYSIFNKDGEIAYMY